ncbi:MAG TPA: succinate dehydrogenase iron-sulfur subunit [Phycisphaerales bacterium]|nr:succinate dehydrogenase iron-sulfur subunit [Phycisphaerales bacterium]
MPNQTFTFEIQRFDPASDAGPHVQAYTLDVLPGATVLEALLRIQAEQDGSLAFRYACRGAVCGSCAMTIDGQTRLACRTQVHALETGTITVAPLANLPVVKDLLVDVDSFLDKTAAVQPWLQAAEAGPEKEYLVPPKDWHEAEAYTNCILCASCQAVCPAAGRDPAYLGPAALAQHYRFLADVRDEADEQRLRLVDSEQGVWGCDMVWNCVEVCPRGVPPTRGIGKTRARIRRAQREREREREEEET